MCVLLYNHCTHMYMQIMKTYCIYYSIVLFLCTFRFDSPGYCAQFCTYTLMDYATNLIIIIQLVERSETRGSSPAMEISGLERALQEVKSLSIDTNCLATDHHPSVVKLICEKYSNREHVFDVCHISKSLQKKLHHISTTKVNSSLQLWSKSIINHVWWAAESCEGDANFLEEKYLSLLKHVSNIHWWEDKYKNDRL